MHYSHNQKTNEQRAKLGTIYILKRFTGNTVKIGETSQSAYRRNRNYSKRYRLRGFQVHKTYKVPFEERKSIERSIHSKLKKFQISGIESARELFDCGVEKAEWAVESSLLENKTAKREIDRKNYLKQAEVKWNEMPWTQSKKHELQQFIETTNFEKLVELTSKEKSAIIDRVWLNGIIGSVVTWASLVWLSDLVIFLLPLGLYFLYKSFDAYSSLSNPPKRVPDQEAVNRRKLKEDELRAGRDKFLRDAEIQFRATN